MSERHFVKYTFLKVDPAWRRLPAEERAQHKQEMLAACEDFADGHLLQSFSLIGTRGDAARCQCQWFKVSHADWNSVSREERARRLREQTGCGDSGAETTSGLVAYLGDEPVGWCAVEPRTAYPRLAGMRIP